MILRNLNLPKNNSFFLFGARGTGKSTLLARHLGADTFLTVDLLDVDTETQLTLNPGLLAEMLASHKGVEEKFCVIDEIQKIPDLLNTVHQQIFKKKCNFALTGSSARKLKREGANMLAGRAFLFHLFPFTYSELRQTRDPSASLEHALTWGSLPEILSFTTDLDRSRFLKSYINTYLREEIIQEQVVRQLRPFRLFLEVAAQCNGEELNYSKISRQIGVDDTTVRAYFSILESTLVGFTLYPYNSSLRKRLSQAPRFFLFDVGVQRMLAQRVIRPIVERTEEYGDLFEHFIILECYRSIHYRENGFELSFARTHDGSEIDLIITRPGQLPAFVEIKSTRNVTADHLHGIRKLRPLLDPGEYFCFSRDATEKVIDGVTCLPWQRGLQVLSLLDEDVDTSV